ncbi:MAG: hypothetical protein NXH95_21615 [Pseudomonadaceae bacterium]|nr:hypothetical protein [Pseudomonadaceae bacterium]
MAAVQALAEVEPSDQVSSVSQAFTHGVFTVGLRYRYEHVDQETVNYSGVPFEHHIANASTLRTRLQFTTAEFKNTFLTLNVDDLRPLASGNFNDTRNGKTGYPVVADPKGTDLNLASITYTGLDNSTIVLGRQRIVRENARFVGNVVWRQNEQTYDAASVDYAISDKLQVYYAYVDRIKRIFGPEDGIPAASLNSKTHMFDASWTISPALDIMTYGYWLDFDEAPELSNRTLGLRLSGRIGDSAAMRYVAELARQNEYKNNPDSYGENYLHIAAGFDWHDLALTAGYEKLGGSGNQPAAFGQAFQTPLATLHAFNGRADQFLRTPGTGLQDKYIDLSTKALGGKLTLTYHDFEADADRKNFGDELDLFGVWKIHPQYSLLAGVAIFDSDADFLADITKVWLMLSADF